MNLVLMEFGTIGVGAVKMRDYEQPGHSPIRWAKLGPREEPSIERKPPELIGL